MPSARRIAAIAASTVIVVAAALLALRTCGHDGSHDAIDARSIDGGAAELESAQRSRTRAPQPERSKRRTQGRAGPSAEPSPATPPEPSAPAQPGRTLVVEVVDAADAPVADAEVVLLGSVFVAPGIPDPQPVELRRATTAASGEARIDVSAVDRSVEIEIRATSGGAVGFAFHPKIEAAPETRVRVRLVPAFALTGRVVVRDGPPAVGAEVVAWFEVDQRIFEVRTRTDSAGRFTLAPIPHAAFAGEVDVQSLPGPGHWRASLVLTGPEPPRDVVVLVVEPTCRIRGRCVDARGAPFAGAYVSVGVGPGHSAGGATSDATGAFEFEAPRNTWALIVTSDRTDLFVRRDVDCDAPELDVGTLVLPDARKCRVRGRCVDASGQPLAGARVVMGVGLGHSIGWGRTDSEGRFDFEAWYGTWAVIVDDVVWRRNVACDTASLDLGTLTPPPPK